MSGARLPRPAAACLTTGPRTAARAGRAGYVLNGTIECPLVADRKGGLDGAQIMRLILQKLHARDSVVARSRTTALFTEVSGLMAGSVNLTQSLVQKLGSSIVRGELPAGKPLPIEAELGKKFGASRTVMR